MTTQEFFEQLDSRIAKYDLLCHPFYKAWATGELTREDLREYGREYYSHVEAVPSYLDEFAARPPDASLRRAILANRDHENGADGSTAHADIWLEFVEGMGGDRSGQKAPAPEVQNLVNWLHSTACASAPEEALAAFYAYECQVPLVATEKARGLREMYVADE